MSRARDELKKNHRLKRNSFITYEQSFDWSERWWWLAATRQEWRLLFDHQNCCTRNSKLNFALSTELPHHHQPGN